MINAATAAPVVRAKGGINYTNAVAKNFNAIQIFLGLEKEGFFMGRNTMSGLPSAMFSQSTIEQAALISPLVAELLSLNGGTLLSHATIGHQEDVNQQGFYGDYLTVTRADTKVRGNELVSLVHPIVKKHLIDLDERQIPLMYEAPLNAYIEQQESLTRQSLKGDTVVEQRLRSILEEFNKDISTHNGKLTFHKLDDDNVLHFSSEGGCLGCGTKNATLYGLQIVLSKYPETKDTIKGLSEIGGSKIMLTP